MSAFPDTPVSLLARFAVQVTGENESGWVRFFEMYRSPIMKFAEYNGAAGDSEDIAQEIFLKLVGVLRRGGYCPDRGSFRSYLATPIRREVINRWRRRQARGAGEMLYLDSEEDAVEIAVPSETEAVLDAKWRLAVRSAALEHVMTKTALSRQSKEIYRRYVTEERPIAEVAAEFGVPNNTVSQTKTRIDRMIARYESSYLE